MLVQFNSSSSDLTLERQLVDQVPISGRNPYNLANLDPSIVNTPGTTAAENRPYHHAYANDYDAGGGTRRANAVLLDGVPLGASYKTSYTPSMDAVEEITVSKSSVDAENGNSLGGLSWHVYGDNGNDENPPPWGSRVLQQGTNQSATVNQTASNRGDNASLVDQSGSGNSAGVTQIANTNVVSGADNNSRIFQNGSGNQATVGQTSNGNTDNTSLINQRASSIDGSANVQQSGDGTVVNNSNIDQSGGSNNSAGVTQSGLGSTHNLSTVIQTGSMNTATIGQSGASLSNTSTLHQTGTGNSAIARLIREQQDTTQKRRQLERVAVRAIAR